MIIFDTETTGLLGPEALPLEKQPSIIEFGAVKLDPVKLKVIDRIEFLINPGRPIPASISKTTGITDDMVRGCPPFAGRLEEISRFFLGCERDIAHNNAFDNGMLKVELERMGKVTSFPWTPEHLCTVEITLPLRGYRLSLGKLYEELTGKVMKEAHRVKADVTALNICVIELIKRKIITP